MWSAINPVVLACALLALSACERAGYEPPRIISVPTTALLAHWTFDEGEGVVTADATGLGHDARLVAMEPTDWVVGVRGTALNFETDDYLEYRCDGCPSFPYSVSLWVNADDPIRGALFSYSPEGEMGATQRTIAFTGDYLHVGQSDSRFGAPKDAFTPGKWHHLAVTYETRASIVVYVDGVDVTVPTDDFWNSGSLTMGRRLNFSALQLDGRLDEVRLYRRAITADEAMALFMTRR